MLCVCTSVWSFNRTFLNENLHIIFRAKCNSTQSTHTYMMMRERSVCTIRNTCTVDITSFLPCEMINDGDFVYQITHRNNKDKRKIEEESENSREQNALSHNGNTNISIDFRLFYTLLLIPHSRNGNAKRFEYDWFQPSFKHCFEAVCSIVHLFIRINRCDANSQTVSSTLLCVPSCI